MILSYIQNISTAHVLLLSASKLANQLGKEFGVFLDVALKENEIAMVGAVAPVFQSLFFWMSL